jgi:hypothetical protein
MATSVVHISAASFTWFRLRPSQVLHALFSKQLRPRREHKRRHHISRFHEWRAGGAINAGHAGRAGPANVKRAPNANNAIQIAPSRAPPFFLSSCSRLAFSPEDVCGPLADRDETDAGCADPNGTTRRARKSLSREAWKRGRKE